MDKCKTCKYSIFDEDWGEYKCEMYRMFIYNTAFGEDCEFYKARKKGEEQKVSKNEYDNNER